MTKIHVEKEFTYGNTQYEPGDIVDLPEPVAERIQQRGYGSQQLEEKEQDSENLEFPEEEGSSGPMWQKKYGLTKTTNIGVQVWPPGQYDNPTIQLTRGEQDEAGDWHNTNINVPIGKCIELAERLKQAAWIVRDFKEDQEES